MCQKSFETTISIGEKQLGPDNNTYLAQIITPKMAKLGPDDNFTAHIYIYIYIYWRVRWQGFDFLNPLFSGHVLSRVWAVVVGAGPVLQEQCATNLETFLTRRCGKMLSVFPLLDPSATGAAEPVGLVAGNAQDTGTAKPRPFLGCPFLVANLSCLTCAHLFCARQKSSFFFFFFIFFFFLLFSSFSFSFSLFPLFSSLSLSLAASKAPKTPKTPQMAKHEKHYTVNPCK